MLHTTNATSLHFVHPLNNIGYNDNKIIIIIIIRNLYSAAMPLGGYRGAGGTGR